MSLISSNNGLQEEIALRLNETKTSANRADRYLNWINLAMQDIHTTFPRAPWLQTSGVSDLIAGDRELELSSWGTDVRGTLSLRISSQNRKLRYVPPETLDIMDPDPDDTGVPSVYTVYDDKLILYPTADAGYEAQLKYYRDSVTMSAASAIPFVPLKYLEAVVYFGLSRGLYLREDYNEAAAMEQKYNDFVDRMRKDMERFDKGSQRFTTTRELQSTNMFYNDEISNQFFN